MGEFFERPCPMEDWHSAGSVFAVKETHDRNAVHCVVAVSEFNEECVHITAPYDLFFQPIDHCLKYGEELRRIRHCEGMLYSRDHSRLIFVELKARLRHGFGKGVDQLEGTIKWFGEKEPKTVAEAGFRRAYYCNPLGRSRYSTSPSVAQRKRQFESDTGFRLVIANCIDLR